MGTVEERIVLDVGKAIADLRGLASGAGSASRALEATQAAARATAVTVSGVADAMRAQMTAGTG